MLYVGSLNYSAVEIVINVQVEVDSFYCVFHSPCFSSRLATKSEIAINTQVVVDCFCTVYFIAFVFAPVYGPNIVQWC